MAVTSPKKPRVVGPPAHWLPPPRFDVVQIPRGIWSSAYWSLPFSHLRKLASAGQNGLTLTTKTPETPHAPVDTVWIREGNADQAWVYHQHWRM